MATSHGFEQVSYIVMDLPAQFGRNQILGPLDSIIPLSTVAIVTLSALQDGFCFAFVLLELSR